LGAGGCGGVCYREQCVPVQNDAAQPLPKNRKRKERKTSGNQNFYVLYYSNKLIRSTKNKRYLFDGRIFNKP
jgi:hypothetical protein